MINPEVGDTGVKQEFDRSLKSNEQELWTGRPTEQRSSVSGKEITCQEATSEKLQK